MNSHFQINYQFSIFTNFYISEMFYRYLKTAKWANMQNYNKRNSKTKSRMILIIGIDVKYT